MRRNTGPKMQHLLPWGDDLLLIVHEKYRSRGDDVLNARGNSFDPGVYDDAVIAAGLTLEIPADRTFLKTTDCE